MEAGGQAGELHNLSCQLDAASRLFLQASTSFASFSAAQAGGNCSLPCGSTGSNGADAVKRLQEVLQVHSALTKVLAQPVNPPASEPALLPRQQPGGGGQDAATDLETARSQHAKRVQVLREAVRKLGDVGCSLRAVLDDTYLQTPTASNGTVPSVEDVIRYGHKIRYNTFAQTGIFPGEPAPSQFQMGFTQLAVMPPPAPPQEAQEEQKYTTVLIDEGLSVRIPVPKDWKDTDEIPEEALRIIEQAVEQHLQADSVTVEEQTSKQAQQLQQTQAGTSGAPPLATAESLQDTRSAVARAVFLEGDLDDSDDEYDDDDDADDD